MSEVNGPDEMPKRKVAPISDDPREHAAVFAARFIRCYAFVRDDILSGDASGYAIYSIFNLSYRK
jgi:hypothetical protein